MSTTRTSVLLGVTGGIAAYKSAEIVRRLRDLGCDVHVAATANALKFVGEPTWAALSGRPVLTSIWQQSDVVGHVSVAREVDAMLIAPATADFMARIAAGRSDDVLSALLLMARVPVVIAPAMHSEMWSNPATVTNVDVLRQRGMLVLEPDSGRLTGPDSGPGRLAAPQSLADIAYCAAAASASDLRGRHVVVTAGGTREPWDPVRWLGNRSSGAMGYAIAAAAVARGADVTVIAANVTLPNVAGAKTVEAGTHADLRTAVEHAAGTADVVVMTAAVADFSAAQQAGKVKRTSDVVMLELHPNTDILARLASSRSGARPLLIGFAAETAPSLPELVALATTKLHAKGCDAIVANDVTNSAVFGQDQASVVIVEPGQEPHVLSETRKLDIGAAVCQLIARRMQ